MQKTFGRIVRMWNDGVSDYDTKRVIGDIEKCMESDPQGLITLEVYSPGGSCDAGFALCDWLSANEVPLQTVGYGRVESMAVPIFLMGKHRVIGRNSSIFLHPVATQYDAKTSFNSTGFKNAIISLEDAQEKYVDLISRLMPTLKRDKISHWIKKETRFEPDKIKKIGFAHEIVGA